MIAIEVGKPYPGQYPKQESCIMQLGSDGIMTILIQFPGLSDQELESFKASFSRYYYLEIGACPLSIWIFNFGSPMGPVEVNFDARIEPEDRIKNYLDETEGLKNAFNFILLDNEIVKGMKLVGMDNRAIKQFHSSISKQLVNNYTKAQFDVELQKTRDAYNTKQLSQFGTAYKKGDKQ